MNQNQRKFVYLTGAFWHQNQNVIHERHKLACQVAGLLMAGGLVVFCPISHRHIIRWCVPEHLSNNPAFWACQHWPMLKQCDVVAVIQGPGWEDCSVVQLEMESAERDGKSIVFIATSPSGTVTPAEIERAVEEINEGNGKKVRFRIGQ